MQVAVLANENPAGLLLAARLALYSGGDYTVRCSIGGRLARLLEPEWSLQISDEHGRRVRIKTANLQAETVQEPSNNNNNKENSATTSETTTTSKLKVKPPQPNSEQIILWLCDWKDSTTTWYALSDCELIIQTSKAVDSKTVAMWLVEVCADNAVVISLQSGLHNVRELREVFGRPKEETSPRLMPLFAAKPKTRSASDDVSSARSRSDSQASFLEELENELDDDQRTQSPAPPNSGKRNSILGQITPNSSYTNLSQLARQSMDSTMDETTTNANANHTTTTKSATTSNLQSYSSSTATNNDIGNNNNNMTNNSSTVDPQNLLKPDVIILAGVLGFQSCAMVDEINKSIKVFPTTDAAMVIERLSRDKERRASRPVSALERARFYIKWRPVPELNNWLWGDLVWRTFDAYGAALYLIEHPNTVATTNSNSSLVNNSNNNSTTTPQASPLPRTTMIQQQQQSNNNTTTTTTASTILTGKSLYALLADPNDTTHRRVFAALIDEALLALQWQRVELMDPATSPIFGLGFRKARAFLLLPNGLFQFILRSLKFLTRTNVVEDDSPFGDVSILHKYMAAFLNGEVVRIGFESDILTPVNQELMEALSSTSSLPSNRGKDRLIKSPLPELIPWSHVMIVISIAVAGIAILIRFIIFVYEVMMYW
jgi:hypothetical protein